MVVYREEGTQKEEDLYDTITVQLTKKSGKGLGLSIVGRKNGPGVFISDVVNYDGRNCCTEMMLNNNSLSSTRSYLFKYINRLLQWH